MTSRDLFFLNLGPWAALAAAVVLHRLTQRRLPTRTDFLVR